MQLSDPSVADKLTSGCPALEELDLSRCSLGVFRVSSDTVKTLSVTACDYLEIHVSAPSIASLKLSVAGRVKLDAMPSQHLELLRFGSLLKVKNLLADDAMLLSKKSYFLVTLSFVYCCL
jgi:hypothetical protein